MRLCGAVLLVFAALLLSFGYKSFAREGVRQAQAFLELLSGLKRHISLSGAPIDRFVSEGKNRVLSELGFYREYSTRGSLYGAFSAVSSRLAVPKEIKGLLSELFSEMGRGELEAEVRRIEAGEAELKEMISGYKKDAEHSVRIVSVMLVAGALGLFIILV